MIQLLAKSFFRQNAPLFFIKAFSFPTQEETISSPFKVNLVVLQSPVLERRIMQTFKIQSLENMDLRSEIKGAITKFKFLAWALRWNTVSITVRQNWFGLGKIIK